jgi:hypothetical protein
MPYIKVMAIKKGGTLLNSNIPLKSSIESVSMDANQEGVEKFLADSIVGIFKDGEKYHSIIIKPITEEEYNGEDDDEEGEDEDED